MHNQFYAPDNIIQVMLKQYRCRIVILFLLLILQHVQDRWSLALLSYNKNKESGINYFK